MIIRDDFYKDVNILTYYIFLYLHTPWSSKRTLNLYSILSTCCRLKFILIANMISYPCFSSN